ncbi:MAG: precorrin-3B C(17)-methyltransferase [Pseudomonadota bacterium]
MKPVVIALSRSGEATAHRVAGLLGATIHGREGRVEKADTVFPNALDHIRTLFAAGHPIIGVCAAGILIRAVAPMLSDKRAEPPVLAVAEDGSAVVPLLGGHRGANRLASRLAAYLDAPALVTTAGDLSTGLALDEPPAGWRLANPEHAKPVMAAILSGARIAVEGELPFAVPETGSGEEVVTLAGSFAPLQGSSSRLVYHPQRLALGVGCARDCPPEELADLVGSVLAEASVASQAIAAIGSLDLKADEPAMNALAQTHGLPFRLFSAQELEVQTPRLANPSDVVFAEVGCHGVAEGAALALAGVDGNLLVEKRKSANATAALAIAPAPIIDLAGRSRGRVSLVGIGPGRADWRTPEASRLIAEADELVGYSLYIDLIGPLAAGKPRHDFPLGGEEARCRFALERAGEGRNVAIICSGDAGIYAMGALVFELMDTGAAGGPVSDAARRVEVVTAPGVSALQAAAARSGAPLGHDFCAISLSDLLTPRDDILRRLRAAAEGDFVIAFYNPVSKRRRTLLAEARDILLAHRPADCPVLLAASLGRPEEELRYRTLEDLDVDEVDMLTTVVVGSSQSRLARLGDGPRIYTPRGYAVKSAQPADTSDDAGGVGEAACRTPQN